MSDLVATWEIALSDGVHIVEFEHGTTTGKRIIRIDGKEIYRQDWMFKLVGKEHFQVGKAKCVITIEAVSGFSYEYTLDVNGKPLKKFIENQSKVMKAWVHVIGGNDMRIVLEKDTLDVWVNGSRVETTGEFVDDGTETHFEIGSHSAYIKAVTTGKRRTGILHQLFVDGVEIPEAKE
ncbi:fas apoptotic inhibitory molecule 1 [Biomphalaria glabrata]|uniref:Fas apoptotic inhibitory molecule 1-like n=2 Tax=Biomphalaria TaxID=6525 RepID=A0A9U8E375_BIOGL|nr:fas apoptotic inhibitory molecule 1-like [Biomphalaria glabrata]XP_055901600.1 fas apoptotic inhibitory molecule 1-like [Biomphalaria glabrata]KAI8743188.1 fas apoptotic inhibitory molecule 1-like [Biomphalaria glabrata]KAI8777949.1 fas apoptotic inhibitory molecule 1 [Biomphalaria glabrata]